MLKQEPGGGLSWDIGGKEESMIDGIYSRLCDLLELAVMAENRARRAAGTIQDTREGD